MWLYNTLTIVCWCIFIAYWIVASIHVKRDKHAPESWKSSNFAITMTLLLVIIMATLAERFVLWQLFSIYSFVPDSPIVQASGTVLCATGIAVAIWARWHLGRNWSSEPGIKEEHVLVTSGPYHFIRHPIYAGILVAAFGSALVGGTIWIFVFLIIATILGLRMRKEEKLLAAAFPEEYALYKLRTHAVIPFLL